MANQAPTPEADRAVEALADSAALYRALFDQAAVGISKVALDGRYLEVNRRLCDLLGYAREELLGMTAFDLLEQGDRDVTARNMARMTEGAVPSFAREKIYLRKDGSRLWCNLSVSLVRTADGRPDYFISVIEDISRYKRAEEEARIATERLRNGLEHLGEMIVLTDAEDRIVLANRRFLEFNAAVAEHARPGCHYADHLKAGIALGLFPDANGREEAWLAERIAVRHRPTGPVERRRQDGRWLLVDDQVLPDGGIVSYGIEITARKRAEEEARRSRDELRLALEYARAVIWDFDLATGMLSISEGWSELGVGPTGERSVSRDAMGGLIHPDDLGPTIALFVSTLKGEARDFSAEYRMLARGGRWHWILSRGQVRERDAQGRATRMTGINIDITERKRAEEALQVLNAELESRVGERTVALETAYRELESFSYSVSHDLRAPLRSISGFASLLREDEGDKLSEEGRRFLAIMDESARRMGRLTDALLSLARTSRHVGTREPVDMKALAEQVARDAADGNPRARVNVADLPAAVGDVVLLQQVLSNLIGNALKYAARTEAPEVEIGVRTEGGVPAYFVRDNGVGFDMEYVDKLFRPFGRLHTDKDFPGTGVGLVLTKMIVERHGGRIWAEGRPGAGATFHFTLEAPRGN